MQPYKFRPVDESEVIADTVIAHHSFTDLPDVWAADEVRLALESGDLQGAADLAEQMSDSDINIFD